MCLDSPPTPPPSRQRLYPTEPLIRPPRPVYDLPVYPAVSSVSDSPSTPGRVPLVRNGSDRPPGTRRRSMTLPRHRSDVEGHRTREVIDLLPPRRGRVGHGSPTSGSSVCDIYKDVRTGTLPPEYPTSQVRRRCSFFADERGADPRGSESVGTAPGGSFHVVLPSVVRTDKVTVPVRGSPKTLSMLSSQGRTPPLSIHSPGVVIGPGVRPLRLHPLVPSRGPSPWGYTNTSPNHP